MRMRAGTTTRARLRPLLVLLASSFLFLAFLATARSAHAADGMPALQTAAVAPPPTADVPAPLQDAITDQTSSATATVAHPDQSNVVVIIRINSPGDDNISQTNVISVGATAANGSSTNQDQSAGASPAPAATRVDGSAPQVSAVPASAPAARPQQDEAPAVAPDRGKVILAAYGRSSAGPKADAPGPAPRKRQVRGARHNGTQPARVETRAPSSQSSAAAPQASPRATHAASLARADRHSAGASPQQRLASWLGGGGRTAAATALAADPPNGSDFGDFALAAVLAGIAACALLAYLPPLRNAFARVR